MTSPHLITYIKYMKLRHLKLIEIMSQMSSWNYGYYGPYFMAKNAIYINTYMYIDRFRWEKYTVGNLIQNHKDQTTFIFA
jgi:hypothetical protein